MLNPTAPKKPAEKRPSLSEADASLLNRACPGYRFAREAEMEFGMVPAECPDDPGSSQAVCFEAYGATLVRDPQRGYRRLRFFVDGRRALEVRMAEGLMGALLGADRKDGTDRKDRTDLNGGGR